MLLDVNVGDLASRASMRSSASAHIAGGAYDVARLGAVTHAAGGAVFREVAIVVERLIEDDAPVRRRSR